MSNKDLGKVIAIQIAPFKEMEQGSIEIQMNGADKDTRAYGVYFRHENGMAKHVDDFVYEAEAVAFVKEHFPKEKIEPYGWQVGRVHMGPDVVLDDSKAFESFANQQDFIKDTQRYDADYPVKQYAGKYGHSDTRNARVMWDGGVAWAIAVMGHLNMSRDGLNGGDIRVIVEGRTGLGKSAICGILADKLKSIGINYEWKGERSEKNLQERPWEVVLQDLFPTVVKIEERNLVPRTVYEGMLSERIGPTGLLQEVQRKGVEDDTHYFIRAAVQHYLNPNMLNISPDDPDRDTKMGAIIASLIDYLYETHQENAGLKFEQRVKNFIRQQNFPSIAGKEYVTQIGDSLGGVSYRAYGDHHLGAAIAKRNEAAFRNHPYVRNDSCLHPNLVLQIPTKEEAEALIKEALQTRKTDIYPGPDGEQQ